MIIDTEKIKHTLQNLQSDDMHRIEISNRHLRNLRQNPKNIAKCQLGTLIKIQNFINRREKAIENENERILEEAKNNPMAYVGIDIGVSSLITLSNLDMSKTIKVVSNSEMKKATKRYERSMKAIEKNLKSCKSQKGHDVLIEQKKNVISKFHRCIEREIHYIVKHDIIKTFGENTLYVVGINHVQRNLTSSHHQIVEGIIQALNKYIELRTLPSKVVTVNEHSTSIRCPKCNYKDAKNRTTSNRFNCRNCDFEHDDDDMVASNNILMNYLKNNQELGDKIGISNTTY